MTRASPYQRKGSSTLVAKLASIMRTNAATIAYMGLLGLFALGALVQPFTAGLGIFGAESFDTHEMVGGIVHLIAVLALVAALISPTRKRDAPWALLLAALATVQLSLVESDTAGVQALHPFLGVSNLLLALWLHVRARRDLAGAAAPASA
jgi:hypothetical protein